MLAVYFLDAVKPAEDAEDVSTPEKWRAVLAKLKAKKTKEAARVSAE